MQLQVHLRNGFRRTVLLLKHLPSLHQRRPLLLPLLLRRQLRLCVFVDGASLLNVLCLRGFHVSPAQVHLDVLRLVRKVAVESAGGLVVAQLHLHRDEPLPQQLGLLEHRLVDGDVEDVAGARVLLEAHLQLCELHPRLPAGRRLLQPRRVQALHALDVPERPLKRNVPPVHLRPRVHAEPLAHHLPRRLDAALAQLELGVGDPQLREAEALVGDHLEGRLEHLPRPRHVADVHLLELGVHQPQVDVPRPVLLLRDARRGRHAPLVHFAREGHVALRLLHADVVEPDVVVLVGALHVLLVLEAASAQQGLLNALAFAVLLLEVRVLLVQLGCLVLGDAVEGDLVDHACALKLLLALLEAGKVDEDAVNLLALVAERVDRLLVALPGKRDLSVLLLEARVVAPGVHVVEERHHLCDHVARVLNLLEADLELCEEVPHVLLRLPLHPVAEHLPAHGHVADGFLEMHPLQPQRVDARKLRHGAVPHVARLVDVLGLHLHLRVALVQRLVAGMDVERAPEDAPRARVLALLLLPLGVLGPVADEHLVALTHVLVVAPAVAPILHELLLVVQLRACLVRLLLRAVACLQQQLLRSDLQVRRRLVLRLADRHSPALSATAAAAAASARQGPPHL
eukprot:Rhum_TRINITY_DN16999_c0_g1::Rhum_TRINITY_DN16999_c0_g1_i1::g.164758::m.164758